MAVVHLRFEDLPPTARSKTFGASNAAIASDKSGVGAAIKKSALKNSRLYLYEKGSQGYRWIQEFVVDPDGLYHAVDVAQSSGKDKRTAAPKGHSDICVVGMRGQKEAELWCVVGGELSWKDASKTIAADASKWGMRLKLFDSMSETADSVRIVSMTNWLPRVQALQIKYLKALSAQHDYNADQNISHVKALADRVGDITKQKPEWSKHIDTDHLKKFNDDFTSKTKALNKAVADSALEYVSALGNPEFKSQLRAHPLSERLSLQLRLLRGLGNGCVGRTYVRHELAESKSEFLETLSELVDPTAEVLEFLEQLAPAIIAQKGASGASDLFCETLGRMLKVSPESLRKTRALGGVASQGLLPAHEGKALSLRQLASPAEIKAKSAAVAAKVAPIMEGLSRCLCAINLGLAIKEVRDDPSVTNQWQLSSVIAEVIEQALDMAKTKAAVAFGEEAAVKLESVAGLAGIVSSGFQYMAEMNEANEHYADGDYEGAVAHDVAAAGAAISLIAAACGMLQAAAGTAVTGVGAPAAVVMGIVGALMLAAGSIWAYCAESSDVEKWLQHCFFGKKYGVGESYEKWRGDIPLQLREILARMCSVEFEAVIASKPGNKQGSLTIKPTICGPNAKIDLTLRAYNSDTPSSSGEKIFSGLLQSGKNCSVMLADGRVSEITVENLRSMMDDKGNDAVETYAAVISIDAYGDGSTKYIRTNSEIKAEQGDLEASPDSDAPH